MKHWELVVAACKQLKSWSCSPVAAELVTCNGTGEVPDAIGWTSRCSILFECKTSRADFLRDRQKLFRYDLSRLGMGDYRFYLGNYGVVHSADELPEGWGYYEVNERNTKPILVHRFGVKYQLTGIPPLAGNQHNEINILRSIIRRKGGYEPKTKIPA